MTKKKSNLPGSIVLLMEDIRILSRSFNIHKCSHVYRKANRVADVWLRKALVVLIQMFGGQTFLKML